MALLLLLPLLPAAPPNLGSAESKALQLEWARGAPLFVLKQPRTGSSWLGKHLVNLGIYGGNVNMEVTNEAMKHAKAKAPGGADTMTPEGAKAYCEEATDTVVSALKGKDGKWGAVSLNAFNGYDMEISLATGKVSWKCMTDIMKAVKYQIQSGKMPPPNLVILTRKNVVSQALSDAKAQDMTAKNACDHPYTERVDVCTERFTWRWKQNPADLAVLIREKEAQPKAMFALGKALQKNWGCHTPAFITYEKMLDQAQGHGLALPYSVTKLIGGQPEDGSTAQKDPLNKVSSHVGVPPRTALSNYDEILKFFWKQGHADWAKMLESTLVVS